MRNYDADVMPAYHEFNIARYGKWKEKDVEGDVCNCVDNAEGVVQESLNFKAARQ